MDNSLGLPEPTSPWDVSEDLPKLFIVEEQKLQSVNGENKPPAFPTGQAVIILKEIAPDTPIAKIKEIAAEGRLAVEGKSSGEFFISQVAAEKHLARMAQGLASTDLKTASSAEVQIERANGQIVTKSVTLRVLSEREYSSLVHRVITQWAKAPDLEKEKARATKEHPIRDRILPMRPIRKPGPRDKSLARKIQSNGNRLAIDIMRPPTITIKGIGNKQEYQKEQKLKSMETARTIKKKDQGLTTAPTSGIVPNIATPGSSKQASLIKEAQKEKESGGEETSSIQSSGEASGPIEKTTEEGTPTQHHRGVKARVFHPKATKKEANLVRSDDGQDSTQPK